MQKFVAFEKPTRACFFQISREVKLVISNNVHDKIWAIHLQRTGLQYSIHSSQLWRYKNAFVLSLILENVNMKR